MEDKDTVGRCDCSFADATVRSIMVHRYFSVTCKRMHVGPSVNSVRATELLVKRGQYKTQMKPRREEECLSEYCIFKNR